MTIDHKSFRGSFLLYRKSGGGMRRVAGSGGGWTPRFRHPDQASAIAEATRLLKHFPQSTFIVLQEVGRVKLCDPDAVTGCADDQTFAGVPAEAVRRSIGG